MAPLAVLRWREEDTVMSSVTGATRNSIGGAVWMGLESIAAFTHFRLRLNARRSTYPRLLLLPGDTILLLSGLQFSWHRLLRRTLVLFTLERQMVRIDQLQD